MIHIAIAMCCPIVCRVVSWVNPLGSLHLLVLLLLLDFWVGLKHLTIFGYPLLYLVKYIQARFIPPISNIHYQFIWGLGVNYPNQLGILTNAKTSHA